MSITSFGGKTWLTSIGASYVGALVLSNHGLFYVEPTFRAFVYRSGNSLESRFLINSSLLTVNRIKIHNEHLQIYINFFSEQYLYCKF